MRKFNAFMLWLVRFTGWPLLILVVGYMVSGFVLCGNCSLERFISVDSALWFHQGFGIPMMVVTVAHSLPAVYLAFWRWGWIPKRTRV